MRKMLLIMIAGLAITGVIYFLLIFTFRASQSPGPSSMPPVVSESLEARCALEGFYPSIAEPDFDTEDQIMNKNAVAIELG